MTLQGTNLAARFHRPVFAGVDLALRAGEVVVVVGPNGAGKSTLLRMLSGIIRPASGHVRLHGDDLGTLPARTRARHIGLLLEPPDATFGFTVRELVMLGRYPHLGRLGLASDADHEHVVRAVAATRLEAFIDEPYPRLSSGWRQMVGVARLMAQDAAFMLLDEPTSRLDPAHALHVVGLLRAEAARGKAVLAVMHDLDLAATLADRMVVLAEGQVLADGPASEVLAPDLIERVWKVRARRVDAGRPSLVLDPIGNIK